MHLMWMYRIHADANTARGYNEISPGLALGLSFIPFFQYPWSGWALMRLAAHCKQTGTPDAPAGREEEAARAAKLCLIASFVVLVSGIIGLYIGWQGFMAGLAAGCGQTRDPFSVMQMNQQSPVVRAWTLVGNTIGLFGKMTFIYSVN